MQVEPLLLSQADTAKALCVSVRTVFSLAESGELPRVRIGAKVLFDPEDIRRFIQSKKITPMGVGVTERNSADEPSL